MNSTPPKVIYMVIAILGVIACTCVCALCTTLFFKNYADPAVLTAIISLGSSASGSLGTILVSTRSQPPNQATTITTTTTPPATTENPQPVVVTNEPANPVPTTIEKP